MVRWPKMLVRAFGRQPGGRRDKAEEDPDDAEAMYLRGVLAYAAGDFGGALDPFESAAATDE